MPDTHTIPQAAPQGRVRLPNRRPALIELIEWNGQALMLELGIDPVSATVREIFLDGHKSGSDLEAHLDDDAVLVSLALQHGVTLGALAASMGRTSHADPAEGSEGAPRRPISLIGHVVACAAASEARFKAALAGCGLAGAAGVLAALEACTAAAAPNGEGRP